MKLSPATKGVVAATVFGGVISPVFYIVIFSFVGATLLWENIGYGLFSGAIFGLIISLTIETAGMMFQRKPFAAALSYIVATPIAYALMSNAIGSPVLSDSMGDGLLGATFFGLFTGSLLLLASFERVLRAAPFYVFAGMLAGAVLHPLSATVGLTRVVSTQGFLTLAILGALVAIVQYVVMQRALKKQLTALRCIN